MEWRNCVLYGWAIIAVCMKLTGAEDGEVDCALDAAMTCFQPVTNVLNCTVLPGLGISAPACDTGNLTLTTQNLALFCNSVDEALNNCLVDLLGSSCSASDPKHGYYQEWLKLINALLKKLCSPESMQIVTESAGCGDESIFKCLFSTQFDLIELLTTEIPPQLCGNIELRAQYCLTTSAFPLQCKPILRLLKELAQDFVDNTQCHVQPVILVPLQKPPTSTLQTLLDESDKTCELDHDVLSACLEPMMNDWNCYFASDTGPRPCPFSLGSLCGSTQEAFQSCAMNLIGYGCEDSKAHQRQYYKWMMALGDAQSELCVTSSTTATALPGAQETYFSGKVSCWKAFFTCLHPLQNQKQLLTLITDDITKEICREIADDIDYCLMTLGFSGDLHECDFVLDKIQLMKSAFTMSAPCVNSSLFLIGNDDSTTPNAAKITPIFPLLVLWYSTLSFYLL